MTDWDDMFEVDELPELFKNVEQAKRLGREKFIGVLFDTSQDALSSPGLPHLLTGLVIGNMAFGAKPECTMALTERYQVHIRIEEKP